MLQGDDKCYVFRIDKSEGKLVFTKSAIECRDAWSVLAVHHYEQFNGARGASVCYPKGPDEFDLTGFDPSTLTTDITPCG